MLAIDGSTASRNAAVYAFRIAKLLSKDIMCINVIGTPPGLRKLNPALVALYFSKAEDSANRWMAEVERLAHKEKVTLTSEVILGALSVPDAIIDYSKKCSAEFIVMGARGASAKKFLLGSVANAVVTRAACPVLLVR